MSQNTLDPTLSRSYDYDHVGRLQNAHTGVEARMHITGQPNDGGGYGPYSQHTGYDVWGNTTRRLGWGGSNGTYTDWTLAYTNNRRDGFSYDAAGNLTFDGGNYTYDATGQQTNATYPPNWNGYTLQQSYDGDGLRAKKVDNGAPTYYLRSSVLGGQVVAEMNSSGEWARGYVYMGGQLLAIQQAGVKWVHQDPVTKSQRLTDYNQNLLAAIDLDPWGGETSRSWQQWQQPRKFTTYERDGNGNDQAMARSYHGFWQRFDQPDPSDGSMDLTEPQSFNRYSYVQNDPVNFIDPSGLLGQPFYNVSDSGRPYVTGATPGGEFSGGTGEGAAAERLYNLRLSITLSMVQHGWGRPERSPVFGIFILPSPQTAPRSPGDVKKDFYKQHGQKLNDCIKKVFGKDAAKVGQQTLKNAAILDARLDGKQVGASSGVKDAVGSSDPFKGPHGTVYVASGVFNGNTPNTLNAIYGTYAHELGNILDIRLNPHVPQAQYGRTYGNPKDPRDTDTGAAIENCVFGSLQYP